MVRLLDACVQVLRQQGMRKMYIDAVKGGEAGFQSIGMWNDRLLSLFIVSGRTLTSGRLPEMGDVQRCLEKFVTRFDPDTGHAPGTVRTAPP